MPFNNSKDGFQNEDEFVKCLDNKKFCNIEFNLRLFLEDLFGVINDNDATKSELQKDIKTAELSLIAQTDENNLNKPLNTANI